MDGEPIGVASLRHDALRPPVVVKSVGLPFADTQAPSVNCRVRVLALLLSNGPLLANPALVTPAKPSRSIRLRFEVGAQTDLLGGPVNGRLLDLLELRMKAWIEREKSQR
jgi:hypothetical protein